MRKDNWIQRLCWKLTGHRWNRKYVDTAYHGRVWCKCRVCGKRLWMEVKL